MSAQNCELEERLSALEKNVIDQRQYFEDKILKLDRENLELKNELFNHKIEIHQLKEKRDKMEERLKIVEQQQTTELEKETKELVTRDETLINEISTIKSQILKLKTMKEKLKAVDQHQIPLLKKQNKELATKNEYLAKEMSIYKAKTLNIESEMNGIVCLRRAMNRALIQSHDVVALNKKVDDMDSLLKSIEERNGNICQSVTSMDLNPRGGLVTGHSMKLDECEKFYYNGMGDKTNACIVTKWNGYYITVVRFVHDGDGEIAMYLKWDRMVGVTGYLGTTDNHNSMCNSVRVNKFTQGTRVWLEAMKIQGNAKLAWCRFECWLLCPF